MLTPIVREMPRVIEPVVRDTFIEQVAGWAPGEQGRPANVIRFSTQRSRSRRPALVSARVA